MSATRRRYDVIVSGGGTAGHVSPALAIARALVDAGHEPGGIHFVGSTRGMEGRLVPAAGFSVTLLPGRGLERRPSLRNLVTAAELAVALVRAVALVAWHRPAVVVAVAGYASVPCSLAARLLAIPVVVVNIDSVPGVANRLVARFAVASAVALPGTGLPRTVVTGAPVRPEILAVDRSPAGRRAAREALGIDDGRFVVVVTGGSLGARTLNDAAVGLAFALRDDGRFTVYHVCGTRNAEVVGEAVRALGITPSPAAASALDYRLVAYEDDMATVLAACDLLVARAGASTVAEVTVVGVPAMLVPLPGAPSDHQRHNAQSLAGRGAALVLDDARCTAERLVSIVERLAGDPAELAALETSARALGRRDAARRIAALADDAAARRAIATGDDADGGGDADGDGGGGGGLEPRREEGRA